MSNDLSAVDGAPVESPKDSFRFLVVDDDADTRALLRVILSKNGYPSVDEAGTGEEALRALREKEYHVVLLDKRMPKMDGLQVLEAAKPIQPDCQFIMISAYGSIETVIEAMNLGAFGFIEKPLKEIDALLKKVQSALQVVEARREYNSMVDRLKETGTSPEGAREGTDEGEDGSP